MTHSRSRQINGFTLVEALIATATALIALMAVPVALRITGRGILLASNGTTAVALAQAKIEELMAVATRDADGHDDAATPAAATTFARDWHVGRGDPRGETRTLSVTVTWDAGGHAVTLETLAWIR